MRSVALLLIFVGCSADPIDPGDGGTAIDSAVDGGTIARLLPVLSPVCIQTPVAVDGSRSVHVRFEGETPVTLTSGLEGSERFLFSATTPSPATIVDGETASIEVGFRPAREGWASVLVRVLSPTTTASAAIRVYGLGLPPQGGAFDAGPLPNGATCP